MSAPLTRTQAHLFRMSGASAGRPAVEMMPQAFRAATLAAAAAAGVDAPALIDRIADSGTPEEIRIAVLEAHILAASDRLAAYLADNTEETFEEIPELDDILGLLREGCS